jgi:hypothetical protein
MPHVAEEQNIEARRWYIGADHQLRVDVVGQDRVTPENMTGWALAFSLRTQRRGGERLIAKPTGGGITISNGVATGDRATITIAAADTLNLRATRYWWALWRTDANSRNPLAEGYADLTEAALP